MSYLLTQYSAERTGENVRQLRNQMHITRQQLSKAANTSYDVVCSTERGKTFPNDVSIERLANALHVHPAAIMQYDFGNGDSITASALFQLSETYGLGVSTKGFSLVPKSAFMVQLFSAWADKEGACKSGSISESEYRTWQNQYAVSFNPRDFCGRFIYTGKDWQLAPSWRKAHLAETLKKLRREKHVSQKQVAVQIGVKQSVIAAYEAMKSLPNKAYLKKLADYFDVTEGYLTPFDFGTPNQAAHALFQLADEYDMHPTRDGSRVVLVASNEAMQCIIWMWQRAQIVLRSRPHSFEVWRRRFDPKRQMSISQINRAV